MRPTIRDVAKRAGVSPATVSRILSGGTSAVRISAATRARVLQLSAEIGYTPDARASSLRSQRSRLVGVIARDITQASAAVLIAVLDEVLKQHGYELLLAQGQAVSGLDQFPEAFDRHRVNGVIFVGTPHDSADSAVLGEYTRRLHRHVVGLTYGGALQLPVSIHSDNGLGVRLAVDHLLALGHRSIAFAGAPITHSVKQRQATFQAYTAALHGVTAAVEVGRELSARTGGEVMQRLLARPDAPTAIIFANDEMAIGGMMAAYQAGRAVPHSLSIVGFDDIPLASGCWPALTTLRKPVRPMAEQVVTSLIELMENGSATAADGHQQGATEPHREYLFPPELIVRGSTAPPGGCSPAYP
ncbi:MAG: LacI family DNA-binding transcriptional regulator [Chloroflexota bacterium]